MWIKHLLTAKEYKKLEKFPPPTQPAVNCRDAASLNTGQLIAIFRLLHPSDYFLSVINEPNSYSPEYSKHTTIFFQHES